MKTKNLLAALLLMACTTMLADNFKYLTISYNGTEQNISLPIVQKITFQDGYVVVTTSEGNHSYPISVMERITFTESADAIKALPEQTEEMTYENGTLAIKGNGLMRVYNTSGALISVANIKEGANISLDGLPTGIYIVRLGDKAIKIKK